MNIHYHDYYGRGFYIIDRKDLCDLTEEEKKNLWLRLVNHLRMNPKTEELQELLSFVMKGYGIRHWSGDINFNM